MAKRLNIQKLFNIHSVVNGVIILNDGTYIKVYKLVQIGDDGDQDLSQKWRQFLISLKFEISINIVSTRLKYPDLYRLISNIDQPNPINQNYLISLKELLNNQKIFSKDLYLSFSVKTDIKKIFFKFIKSNQSKAQQILSHSNALKHLTSQEMKLISDLDSVNMFLTPLSTTEINSYFNNIFYLKKDVFIQ